MLNIFLINTQKIHSVAKSKRMKLHELRPAKGATHKRKRIGRGDGSGHGGTSTKGTKGQQSRTGYKRLMSHEGERIPIQRRIPERCFQRMFFVLQEGFQCGANRSFN